MKTKECIHCERFFECKGKEKDKPCLHYKERRKKQWKSATMIVLTAFLMIAYVRVYPKTKGLCKIIEINAQR